METQTTEGNGEATWEQVAEASETEQAALKERIDAPGRTEKRRYTTRAAVKLTTEQKAELADKIAKLRGQLDNEELAKKEAADAHNAVIKELDSEIGKLASDVRRGEVLRDVKVAEVWDEQQGAVLTFRLDTDPPTCIETRAMTAAERQGELDLAAVDGVGEVDVSDDDYDEEPDDTDEADEDELED